MKEAARGKTSELVCVQSIPQILPQAGQRSSDFIKLKARVSYRRHHGLLTFEIT